MGSGATKDSKPLVIKDDKKFSDISESNLELVSTVKNHNQARKRRYSHNIMAHIQNAVSWPKSLDSEQFSEFQDAVGQLLEAATKEMTTLARENKCTQVEEITQAIMRLGSQWGEEILDSLNLKSFIREVIFLKLKGIKYTINAGEYFKAEPFYAGDNRLVVLNFFNVRESVSKSRIMSYYLECSRIIQPYFVLGLSVSGSHLRVCSFDRCRPSYWVVRETVLRDMEFRINAHLRVKRERETMAKREEREIEEDLREGVIV